MTAKKDVLDNEQLTIEQTGLPSNEQVLMNEQDLISGLLAASDYKTDESTIKRIEIKRNGNLLFMFEIRPLSEKELMKIRKESTKTYKNPGGKNLPPIEGELRMDEFRSRKIYAATTDEYKAKLWDNPQVKASLNAKGHNIIMPYEIIDAVLMAGEKYAVSEKIDDISGYNDEEIGLEEYAKN